MIKIISLKTGLNNTIINSAKLNTIELKKHYTRQNYQEYLEMFILGNQNIVTINPSIYNTEIEFTTFLLYQIKNINDEIDEIIMVSQAHHSELILLCCEIINSELVIFIINNVYNIQSERMTFNPFHIEQLSIWLEEYNMRINNLTKYLKKL